MQWPGPAVSGAIIMASYAFSRNSAGPGGIGPEGYRPRVVDDEMRRALRTMPAVLIEGPRACGKTWTGRRFAGSAVFLDDTVGTALSAGMNPASVLGGATPRLLDEWQLAPGVWNPMRRACDTRGLKGQFILTGSADPPDDITRHSGTGRVTRVRMRPMSPTHDHHHHRRRQGRVMRVRMRSMSLYESGESDGNVSLRALLEGGECAADDSGLTLGDVLELACRGGWPQWRDADTDTAGDAARAYLDEISRTDNIEGGRDTTRSRACRQAADLTRPQHSDRSAPHHACRRTAHRAGAPLSANSTPGWSAARSPLT